MIVNDQRTLWRLDQTILNTLTREHIAAVTYYIITRNLYGPTPQSVATRNRASDMARTLQTIRVQVEVA